VKTPGQNGSRERGFGTLKYERLFIDEIDDAVMLVKRAEEYRLEYNQVRPHEAIAWNRPKEVHLGLADPLIPTFQSPGNPAESLTRDKITRLKKTIDPWWPAIATLIRTRATNAKTEAANVTVKNIKRTGRGYRSHENYRCRIMLYNAARMAA
jgi:Transposase/Integrase core domain